MTYFAYRHLVSFEETNLVGNVFYVNHFRWQGRCREQFLYQEAPDILNELQNGLVLATMECSCAYFQELSAFDSVELRMYLAETSRNQIEMRFDYIRLGESETLAARGSQRIACMRRDQGETVPVPIPPSLQKALEKYR